MLQHATYHIITFGCQMNKHDSERMAGMLNALGATSVDTIEEADVVVFVTCCVREKADERLMGQVQSMKNIPVRTGSPFPKRYVCIGGCIGQRDAEALTEQMSHVDVVFGTHNLEELPQLLTDAIEQGTQHVHVKDGRPEFHDDLPEEREHAWAAWLPITVGCNNFCSYCIVPYVRGREISRPLDEIVEQARTYVSQGVREITLLGQNVNSYGRDLYGEPRFAQVLDAVSETGIERIRFATSHPKDLTDEVIERFGSMPNLMPALHLPFQSGSNRILKAMRRVYTREHYLELIDKIRAVRSDIALSTDVIVGFPGETEEDFQQTYDLIDQVGYTQVFTFIYSKREGTPAAKMEDDTPKEVIQERFDRLVDLVQKKAYEANQVDKDTMTEILIEGTSKRDDAILMGKSPKNQTVHVPIPQGMNPQELLGKLAPVAIDEAKTWYLKGRIIGDIH